MRQLRSTLAFLAVFAGGVVGRVEGQQHGSISTAEYEGWRQYSVQCARCHGQDALPNPVAANLLVSMAPGGPTADKETYT